MKKMFCALAAHKKKWSVLGVVLLAALLCAVLYRWAGACVAQYAANDYFVSAIANYDDEVEDLTLSMAPDVTEAAAYAITMSYTLDAAEYSLTIEHAATDNDFYIYVATTNEYDLATDTYPVFAQGVIAADTTSTTLQFSLAETHALVQAYVVYTGEGTLEITATTLESLTPVSTDRYARPVFYLVLLFALVLALVLVYRASLPSQRKARLAVVLCVAAMAYVTSQPLLQMSEIAYGHDVSFHVNRIAGLYQELCSGHFPARINSVFNSGYGYLNSVLYPEAFLYLSALLMFAGVSTEFAQNVLIILMNILCPLLAYLSFYKISKHRPIALATTALYAMSVYRMSNLYVRAALGEFFFLGFLPLMLYAVYHLFFEDGKRWWLLAVAATCILQSHVLGTLFTAGLFGVFLLALFAVRCYHKQPWALPLWQLVKAGCLTVLLNLWFLVPFLYYFASGTLVLFDTEYEFTTHFMPNMVAISDVFTFAMAEGETGVRLSLGAFLFAVLIACIVVAMVGHRITGTKQEPAVAEHRTALWRNSSTVLVWCNFAFVALFTVLFSNEALWTTLAQVDFLKAVAANIQYSFRLIGLIVFCICMIFLLLAMRLPAGRCKVAVGCMVFACAFGLCYHRMSTDYILTKQDVYNIIFLDSPPEYLLTGTDYAQETWEYQKVQTSSEAVVITAYEKEGCVITFTYENNGDATEDVRLPLFYYEGYRATLSTGEHLPVTAGVNNVLHVILPPNSSDTICVEYYDNRYFRLANLASLTTLLGCLLLWWWAHYQKRYPTSKLCALVQNACKPVQQLCETLKCKLLATKESIT